MMKYYGIFASRDGEPSDIWGYELTGGGRRWSRSRVELIEDGSKDRYFTRSSRQRQWNWARELAAEGRKEIGKDYRVFVCRINSRHCPVEVRIDCHGYWYYHRHPEEYDKYGMKNGVFKELGRAVK